MEEKIQLMSAEFCGWMESEEKSLSKARDELDLLEARQRRLSDIWESGAQQQWEAGFQRELSAVRQYLADLAGLIKRTQETAQALLQVERGLIGEAEKL